MWSIKEYIYHRGRAFTHKEEGIGPQLVQTEVDGCSSFD